MKEDIRVFNCYAITIKYLPSTNTKGTRIKLIPSDDLKYGLNFNNITLPKEPQDYSTDSFKQAINYVVNVMGMPLPRYNLNTGEEDILIFKIDFSFSNLLRSFSRLDCNIILLLRTF